MAKPHDFGYTDQPSGRSRRKLAATFVRDAKMERLLDMQRTQPEEFAKLSITTRLSAGHYAEARAAYEETHASD